MANSGAKPGRFFYGYIIVAAGFFSLVAMEGALYSFGIFLEPLTTEFGWTRAETSGAYALLTGLHGFLYIVSGRLTDRFGPRKVLTVCGLLLGTGYLLTSQITALWQLYVTLGIIVAMGQSGGFVPLLSTVARWFNGRRGLMSGIVIAGIGVGTMVMPPLASRLIAAYDWRTSYQVIGLIVIVVLVTAARFLKRDPARAGLKPYPAPREAPSAAASSNGGVSLRETLRTREFRVLAVMLFSFGFGQISVMTHVVPAAIDAGAPGVLAANIMAFIGGAGVVGRIGVGGASDRLGNRLSIVLSYTLLCAALIVLVFARELPVFYLVGALFGFGYGAYMAVLSPTIAELYGLKEHGAIFGVLTFVTTTGGAIGPLVTGRIFDTTGSYFLAFSVCAALMALGLGLAVWLKRRRAVSLLEPRQPVIL